MASVYHFSCDANQIINQVITEEWQAEESREKINSAIIIIQSYFRGMVVRKHMRKLHNAATIIQKNIRRFLVRINFPNYLLAYLENRALSYYNKMATKIQAAYRGFSVRKFTINVSGLRKEDQRVKDVNEKLITQLESTKNELESKETNEVEIDAKNMVLFILFKVHHLLRTDREGILSDYKSSELSWIENLLKSLRFTEYMKELRRVYDATYRELPERPCIMKGRMRQCEKAYYMKYKGDDVKPPPPVDATAFQQQKPFKLSAKIEKKYVPMALTRGKYTLPITRVLRDLDSMANISVNDFDLTERVVPERKLHPDYYIDFWKKICQAHQFPEYK